MIPPDFATFWSQAAQQGFKPKIVTIGKALLFPSVIDSLGAARQRAHHARSGGRRTIRSSRASPARARKRADRRLRQGDQAGRGRSRSASSTRCSRWRSTCSSAPKALEPKAILDAIMATNYKSIVGPVKWTGQPVKNVTKTPLVAGQWQRKGDKFDLVITTNKTAPEIPVGGTAAAAVVAHLVTRRHGRACPGIHAVVLREHGWMPDSAGHDGMAVDAAMPPILALDKISKRFGAVVVADGDRPRARRGRGARHHRAERRRQDHAVRHHRPARCAPTPAACCSPAHDITRAAAASGAAGSASRARSRSRSRSAA